jgi:hypothetical protein
MYRGLPAKMMRFAEMQVLAGLLKLHDEGRASAAPDGRYSAMSGRPSSFK